MPSRLIPLGVWPDWEKATEMMDERGPLSQFTVTVEHLQSEQDYTVHVIPVLDGRDGDAANVSASTGTLAIPCPL